MLLGALQHKKILYAYGQHRRDAKKRGIPFKLSFEEWFNLWVSSGHLFERGRCKGQYVMARIGDNGAYEIGNAFIQLCEQNHIDAAPKMRGIKRSEEQKRRMSEAKKGTKHTAEQKAKNSAAHKGLSNGPMSAETKQKLRLAKLGRKGHVHTAESKAKMSLVKYEFWAHRKAQMVSK